MKEFDGEQIPTDGQFMTFTKEAAMPKRTTKNENSPVRKRSTPSKRGAAATDPTLEEIERRAYDIFLARGDTSGNAFDDWLQAEQELKQEKGIG